MSLEDLKKNWTENYKTVPESLGNVKKIKTAATAFNANVDAVIKISGKKLLEYINEYKISFAELTNIKNFRLDEPRDVIKGIFRCFSKGIGEEWISEDIKVYDWMVENIGYDRIQMGGQGGIVANILAVAGIERVYAHTNSLPKLQAKQFLHLKNLLSFNEKGEEAPAYEIDRTTDIPLIHWIIEFDIGDSLELEGKVIACPKSNRFIATYDPLNLNLIKDEPFVKKLIETPMDFIVLSGFHALIEGNNGLKLVEETVPAIKKWKNKSRDGILHLEIASTQDKVVRKAIVDRIAAIVDSIGVNERETIDILEVIGQEKLARECEKNAHSVNLFKGVMEIKKYTKCPRIQMHIFGLYLTVQNKDFKVSAEANLRGMELAAVVAASKAGTGHVNEEKNLLWAYGREVSDIGLSELSDLAQYIGDDNILKSGISEYDGFDIIAVPTILIEKPKTLVGMGDTISSVSLIGTI
ncbi:MAG: hypothetical protein LBR70_00965 [Lactobacillaceae bacterium]|jgi:ADP-dependent phosphofructokinase/glucokinase|nr:hypothetical protein [Lactobacillaceae bacterium]